MMSGSDYVVIAARRPLAVALQGILRDWVLQGVVSPCRIVDLDSLQPQQDTVPAFSLSQAGCRGVSIRQELSGLRVARVRLCIVGCVDEEDTRALRDQAIALQSLLRESLPGAPTVLISLTVGSPNSQWQSRSLVMIGWHNLALAPEQSEAPGRSATPLAASLANPAWHMLVAGSLAGILGLWPGQRKAPFDLRQPPAGELLTPVRVFSRSLSSGSVQQELSSRLVSVDERYPAPYYDRRLSSMVDDEVPRAVEMAERLFEKHSYMMPRVRHATPPKPPSDISAWAAVGQFLRFVGDSLRRVPTEIVRAANRAVAQGVQNMVYGGSDSSYAVVVGGVRADGSSASWTDYEQSLDSVITRSMQDQGGDGAQPTLAPIPQLRQLWSDYAAGGLTLLDAGERVEHLPPIRSGQQRSIIATTARVAPDPTNVFKLPASLAAFLPNWEIQPGDDIEVGRLFERFEVLSRNQPHLAQEISNERNRLRQWAEAARASYSGFVGGRLADAHRSVIQELDELDGRIEQLSSRPPEVDQTADIEDNMVMKVSVLSAVTLSVVAILVALMVLGVFAWPWLIVGIFAAGLSWLVVGAVNHMSSSRRVFEVLNRRRAADTELSDAKQHRIEALEDLRRISRGYRQYLDWARVFGAFVHAPYGYPQQHTDKTISVGQGLPLNIGIGVAKSDEDATDAVAANCRSRLFTAGWLTDPWREFQETPLPGLGTLEQQLAPDRLAMLSQDPVIEGEPVLSRWSRELARVARQRPVSDGMRQRVTGLTVENSAALNQLLTRVQVCDSATGQAREVNREEFIAGLETEVAVDSFQPGLFAKDSSELDVRQVRQNLPQNDMFGLDQAIVVVQLGGDFMVTQYAGTPIVAGYTPEIHETGDFV
ncbi:hypothetical protein [Tessaracoccus sp. OH4464_COT-324]|uniref:hypothetical protein n=1 Tax=Tessaracoccus sp. OH4464_COT-324 TaxID=2491059 RepID=UPI000F63FE4D|nr:hypothetical protein [Tessaracoccus sp. OH4464_COT-324]RRD46033.1 hypothetical protein EII42_08765 [Tessaracoccus sp. OH4464_COT-324]